MAAYTTIDNPELYFQVKLYTGNGTAIGSGGQAITFDGEEDMQPDWVWIKERDDSTNHQVYDAVRGVTKRIYPDGTFAEDANSEGLTTFGSNGFTLGSDGSSNGSSDKYVAWCWKASGSTATNTAGNVDTTISANTTAGFSIISADAGSTSGELTLGHGLGTVPTMMIWKNREDADQNWQVYHQANGTGLQIINLTTAKNTDVVFWNTHTTTLFKMATHMYTANKDFIGYCFSDVQGFSKFGSYTGNGNADGTFINLGFRPALVIAKRSDSTANWYMMTAKISDSGGGNPLDRPLFANDTQAENDGDNNVDLLSNGFKIRGSGSAQNGSGATYIYMAFAEQPFVNSNGVPCNAR